MFLNVFVCVSKWSTVCITSQIYLEFVLHVILGSSIIPLTQRCTCLCFKVQSGKVPLSHVHTIHSHSFLGWLHKYKDKAASLSFIVQCSFFNKGFSSLSPVDKKKAQLKQDFFLFSFLFLQWWFNFLVSGLHLLLRNHHGSLDLFKWNKHHHVPWSQPQKRGHESKKKKGKCFVVGN